MENDGQFAGTAVLVSGGSRGIGAEVARRFADQGARVAIGCRGMSPAAEALAADLGAGAVIVTGDIGRRDQATAMVQEAHRQLGGLDVLVNSAGIGPYRPLAELDEEFCRALVDTNLMGTVWLTQAAAPLLRAPGGRIVHFSSRLAVNPLPASAVYSATKAGVSTLTHAFARELGPKGITVNAVAPGVIETDMTAAIIRERGDGIRAATPLGRIGQPGDIAGIVMFLASEAAGWITGRTILADGGLN